MNILLGIVDDHQLVLKSISLLLSGMNNFTVTLEASNGKDLQEKIIMNTQLPDIILIDVNMPVMNGVETAEWLTQNYPQIKLAALTINEDDKTIIQMIKAGCCAYLLKDTNPDELEKALHAIALKGYYNSDATNINYCRLIQAENGIDQPKLTDKEQQMLEAICSDKGYKQIAAEKGVSERTVDSYREILCQKLKVQSRVGLVLEAIRKGIVKL